MIEELKFIKNECSVFILWAEFVWFKYYIFIKEQQW